MTIIQKKSVDLLSNFEIKSLKNNVLQTII